MLNPQRAILIKGGDGSPFETNFELRWSVVSCTKSRMAFFAGPSFQEGSGSSAALATRLIAANAATAAEVLNKSLRFISTRVLLSNLKLGI